MKTPTDCTSLPDVRDAIDHIDEQVIALLGLRADYVRAAARFKTSEAAVAAPDRREAMLEVRRGWAERESLDPDFIGKLYEELVAYFTAREVDHWRAANPAGSAAVTPRSARGSDASPATPRTPPG